jgi:hypothetical protein
VKTRGVERRKDEEEAGGKEAGVGAVRVDEGEAGRVPTEFLTRARCTLRAAREERGARSERRRGTLDFSQRGEFGLRCSHSLTVDADEG